MGLFRRRGKDLQTEGIPGTAWIVGLEVIQHWGDEDSENDPGGPLADLGIGNIPYRMQLEITLQDGRPPYVVSGKFKVPARHDLAEAGRLVPMRADPDDPSRVWLDWKTLAEAGGDPVLDTARRASEPEGIYANFPEDSRSAMVNGWVFAAKQGAMSREAFDEAIDGAVDGGILTPADADAARAALG